MLLGNPSAAGHAPDKPLPVKHDRKARIRMWLIVVCSAALVGVLRGIIGLVTTWLFRSRVKLMTHTHSAWLAFLLDSTLALPLVIAAAGLVLYVCPSATGGGIADIKAHLNGADLPSLFSKQAFFVRCLSIPLSAASGMIIGTEAPLTHLGSLTVILAYEAFFKIRPEGKLLTDLVTMGTAFGSCAAFLTPICGFLMVREELSLHWDSSLSGKTIVGCAIAAGVARLMRLLTECHWNDGRCMGAGGVLGNLDEEFGMNLLNMHEISCVLFIGVTGGLLGAALSYVTRFRFLLVKERRTTPFWKLVYAAGAVIAMTGCYMLIAGLSACVPVSDQGLMTGTVGVAQSLCSQPDMYNPAALYLFEPRYPAVKALFHNFLGASEPSSATLAMSAISVLVSLFFLLGMQVPYGLVFPNILMGALFGRLVGRMFGVLPGAAAVLGVGAALAGLRRTIAPIAILVLELTGSVQNLLPLVMTCILAKFIGDALYKRQFDVVIECKGYPVLGNLSSSEQRRLEHVTCRDICSKLTSATLDELGIALLQKHSFSVFPVVDDRGVILGFLSRQNVTYISELPKADRLRELPRIFAKEPPLIMEANTPFVLAYNTFRKLGLRQLVVIDEGKKTGIITRTDLVRTLRDARTVENSN